ncbi:mevalonate kinase-like [Amphiura filiformis]|uniref:mevalonate kinase-like n=1 Tax=Amphiura filiformis TaxID=82378 RepID=UPI003B216AF3
MATSKDERSHQGQNGVIFVSAPGKVILHGEHAVVYGKTALATSLNLRTFLRLKPTADGKVTLRLPDIDLNQTWELNSLQETFSDLLGKDVKDCNPPTKEQIEKLKTVDGYHEEDGTKGMALIAFVYLYLSITGSKKLEGCNALVVSQLPTGAGLGSSAAFSVCLAASLLRKVGAISVCGDSGLTTSDLELINKWAFEGERLIHGNPSGIDNSVSVFGGALRFKNKPQVSITPLDKMPQLRILLINTKVPRSTKELVAGVREKLDRYPSIINPVLEAVDNLAITCELVLKEMASAQTGDQMTLMMQLEELVDMNQHFLSILGVSHPSLQQICLTTSQYGLHSKLTGAGGGGCAFTLIRPDTIIKTIDAIDAKMRKCGYEAWETCLGGVGVVCHRSREDLEKFEAPADIYSDSDSDSD